jgi:hypothetical protein
VSYQDEAWWDGPSGDRYLETHKALAEGGVEMTRIFLVDEGGIETLMPTLERHIELGIATYVIDPAKVEEQQWRDLVIYDDILLRTANPVNGEDFDRKAAVFTDNPSVVQVALMNFEDLRTAAIADGGDAELVVAKHKRLS